MPNRFPPRLFLRLVVFAAILAGDGPAARASGFQLREQSAGAMGHAFAGATALADDLSTLFYNPAGMARLGGTQAEANLAWVVPTSRFSGSNTIAPGGSDGGNHSRALAVGAAYALWDPAPDWRVGLAVTAPFGMRSDYQEDWVGRYHALDTSLTAINVSPSVSYRIDDRLSVAAGIQISHVDTELTNAINFGALIPGAADGMFRASGDDVAFGVTASLLYQFAPGTRLGIAYRSSVRHAIHGKARFENVPGALAGGTTFADSGTDTAITLPDTVSVGLYHALSPEWAVMSDISWTRWSVFRTFRLGFESGRPDLVQPQNWHDTWFFALGATYRANDRLQLHVGAAYDMSPVDDPYRNARIPDSDRIWLSAGLSYAVTPDSQLRLSYAHIFGGSESIAQADPSGIGGTLVGSYDNHVDIISASYAVSF